MAQSPALYEPSQMYIGGVTRAWATTGNTDTVTDPSIASTTFVDIMQTSASAGRWYVSNITPSSSTTNAQTGVITFVPGTFTITSSSSETQVTTTYQYVLQ